MSTSNPEYWRRKLSAFLHDSPDKVISLVDHEGRACSLAQVEGFQPTEAARKEADFAASAADRLPWPKSKLCRSEFNATGKALLHPLGQAAISFTTDFVSAEAALTDSQATRPRIADEDPRAAFITAWRFWQNWASSADERLACLPAETRLPDHTIWNHLAVTSALQGCYGGSQKAWSDAQDAKQPTPPPPDRPAFLLFTVGPVQDFIAAARNTRDLWSGSYLLSYLVGTALAKIALDFGPDHVLFPSLTGQPMLDLLLKRDLWDHVNSASGERLWQAFGYHSSSGKERLLTPSLPNRFLAVLPSDMIEHESWRGMDAQGRCGAARYAAHLEQELRNQIKAIAKSVADKCAEVPGAAFDRRRFDRQVARLLEVHWQVMPWPDSVEAATGQAERVPGEEGKHPLDPIRQTLEMLDRMPKDHRDPRYFLNHDVGTESKAGVLGQVSNAWSALFASVSWQLDAVKATRNFPAWSDGGWLVDRTQNKDSLNGREEACIVVPTKEDDARKLSQALAGSSHAFKPGDLLGASTLLKRLWHLAWLSKEHAFDPEGHNGEAGDFAMPNTQSIAAHQPFASNADDDDGSEEDGKYFAILALDGDEMGKWISGVKCPELTGQLSAEAHDYFGKHGNAQFLKVRRPLSPSFHLQFSELLANFGIHCVRRIVQAFDGRLLYAGGDDVLAMLPADTALGCARALRAAFRGEKTLGELAKGIVDRTPRKREHWHSDRETKLFSVQHEGFLKLTAEAAPKGHGAEAGLLSEPVTFPFLVPGPAADCSVGIAIAHFKSPLQDVVREAQRAEKRAKQELGRSAVAVTLMKRSGEIQHWGARWDNGGIELFNAMLKALAKEIVSAKFPHRIVQLVEPYQTDKPGKLGGTQPATGFTAEVAQEILLREIAVAADRQRGTKYNRKDVEDIVRKADAYLQALSTAADKVNALIGLCQTVAFAHRTAND